MSWTLYYSQPNGSGTQSVKLELLGSIEGAQVTGDAIKFTFSSHKASELNIEIPDVNPINAPQIPFMGQIKLVDAGGTTQFVGRRIDWDGKVSGERKCFSYQFQDAWWDLSKITYKNIWWSGAYVAVTVSSNTVNLPAGTSLTFMGTNPTAVFYDASYVRIGSGWNVTMPPTINATSFTVSGGTGTANGAAYIAFQYYSTDVVLFQYSPGDPYQTASQVVNFYITTGAQISNILQFAIGLGVNLQIGEIDPSLYVPWYPARCQNCMEAIKICLRDHPDCFTEIDYTTNPPTFNVRKRSNLTPKTLPYGYTDTNGIQHISTDVKPRPDLIPSRIGIFYRYMMNGQAIAWPQDIYPLSAPDGLLALDYTIDIQGPRFSASTGQVISTALPSPLTTFNPANKYDWWLQHHPQFEVNTANTANAEITGNATTYISLCDSTGNTSNPIVNVTDVNGNPIDLTVYKWELVGGGQALWMSGINCVAAKVQTWFNYSKNHINSDGTVATQPDNKVLVESVTVNVNLVNTPSIQQSYSQLLTTGEAIPQGLAQSIYTSLQTMQYNVRQEQKEEPFTSFIKPGKHSINLAGGNSAWSTMNATVQETSYTLHQRPDGTVWCTSEVSCGPVEHLEAGQLVQLFNIFALRDVNKIDPWERITGNSSAGGQGAVQNTQLQNSVHGVPASNQTSVTAANQGTSDVSNTIVHDPGNSTSPLAMHQYDTTTSPPSLLIGGVLPVIYSGSGVPSSGLV